MGKTSIQWCDYSINPIRARNKKTGAVGHFCEKVSHGCTHCYASALQGRFNLPAFKGARSLPTLPIGDNGCVTVAEDIEVFLDEGKLQEVLRRKKPTRYFWADMTDLFGSWVPDEWLHRCFAAMALTPQHTHQLLTKRPERMREYIVGADGREINFNIPGRLMNREPFDWPLPNVWLGVSVEDQQRKERIDVLRPVPAVIRFLSLEPLLEDLGELNLDGIHLCIVGGESGKDARPCDVAWVRSIVKQCKTAGVAAFCKQLGSKPVDGAKMVAAGVCGRRAVPNVLKLRDPKGGEMREWPEDLRIRSFPDDK